MAGQAALASFDQIARIVHAEFYRLLKCPAARRVRSEPVRGGAVAIFATHAVVVIKGSGALSEGDIQGMARQTLMLRLGVRQAEDLPHPLTDRVRKNFVSLGVLVLNNPSAVFVLEYGGVTARLHAAMAAR